MISGIIGKKLGMTQVFRENGQAEAVTAVMPLINWDRVGARFEAAMA